MLSFNINLLILQDINCIRRNLDILMRTSTWSEAISTVIIVITYDLNKKTRLHAEFYPLVLK